MRNIIKKTMAYIICAAMLLPGAAFADDEYSADANPETYIFYSGKNSPVSDSEVQNFYPYANRCSPVYCTKEKDGSAYNFHTGYADSLITNINMEGKNPDDFFIPERLHRVMSAYENGKYADFTISDFENCYIEFSIKSGANYNKVNTDADGDKVIRLGLAHTSNDALDFPSEVKYVNIKNYGDLGAVTNGYTKFVIPVKDIMDKGEFYAINGSNGTRLRAEDVNSIVFAIDLPDPRVDSSYKSSTPIFSLNYLCIVNRPSEVQNISYTSKSDEASLSWDAVSSGEDVSYNIFRDGKYIATTAETSFTDTGLEPNTDYSYGIQTHIGKGTSQAVNLSVRTKNFFSDSPLLAASFENVKINGDENLKGKTVADGTTTICGTLIKATSTAVLQEYMEEAVVAAVFIDEKGIMQDIDIDNLNSAKKDFSLSLETKKGGEVRFFAVDSLEKLTLLSQLGIMNDEGFFVANIAPAEDSAENVKVDFDSADSGFFIADGSDSRVVLLAYPKETDLSGVTKENVKDKVSYLYVTDASASQEAPVKIIFDSDTFKDGEYLFAVTTVGNSMEGKPCEASYATPTTISLIYGRLNDPAVTVEQATECLENPILKLDLTDFNRVSKEKAVQRFLDKKPELKGVSDIKAVLDEAVGTVLFCSAVEKSDADVTKYKDIIGLDSDVAAALIENKDAADVKQYAYKLMGGRAASEISNNNANEIFKDCYVAALASSKNNTWKSLKNVIEKYNLADTSKIPSSIDEAEVYKGMLNTDFTQSSEVGARFEAVLADAIRNANKQTVSGGGGGGGRTESASPVSVYVPDKAENITEVQQKNYRTFSDVPRDFWAYNSIEDLVDRKVISIDEKFRPDDTITREEFVKLLVLSCEIISSGECEFDDVSKEAWYAPYVNAAFSQGIVNGVSDTHFGIGDNITRQDMAVMIYRTIPVNITSNAVDVPLAYGDAEDISDYAVDAFTFLNRVKVINGDENGKVRPEDFATRAESAKMICTFLDFLSSSR
ncbi:MAG: S-layer homology domain-containing protein [Monoglobaceae bacterium]